MDYKSSADNWYNVPYAIRIDIWHWSLVILGDVALNLIRLLLSLFEFLFLFFSFRILFTCTLSSTKRNLFKCSSSYPIHASLGNDKRQKKQSDHKSNKFPSEHERNQRTKAHTTCTLPLCVLFRISVFYHFFSLFFPKKKLFSGKKSHKNKSTQIFLSSKNISILFFFSIQSFVILFPPCEIHPLCLCLTLHFSLSLIKFESKKNDFFLLILSFQFDNGNFCILVHCSIVSFHEKKVRRT